MAQDLEQYILHRSSLPIGERVSLAVRDIRFKWYSSGLEEFQEQVGRIPVFVESYPSVVGNEAKPLDRDELFESLARNLKDQNATDYEIDRLKKVYEFAHDKFSSTPGKEKRRSGEETITHSLWMANLLAINGVTNIDVQMATLLHDVHEDTETPLEEITEISSPKAAQLVDIVTKVKTVVLLGGETNTQQIKEKNEKETLEKILAAIEKDPRALIIKAADVVHNQMTSDYVRDETRITKGNLALDFYEPIVRRLGFTELANLIGDYAFRSVQKPKYERILALKEESDQVHIPFLAKLVDSWTNYEATDGENLSAQAVNIDSPTVYQIHQAQNNEDNTFITTPSIQILCNSETDLFRWHRFLNKKYSSQQGSDISDIDDCLNNSRPVEETIFVTENGDAHEIKVVLGTSEMFIEPAHLFIDTVKLTPEETQIANTKLAAIRDYYGKILIEEETTTQFMTEAMRRGLITVFDRDGNPQSIPSGSTAADLAYRIGKNLGNDSVSARVYYRIGEDWAEFDDTDLGVVLTEGLKVEFVTKSNQSIDPNRYELVTTEKAIKNISERVVQELVDFAQADGEFKLQLESGKIIKNIRKTLGVDFDDNIPYPELIQKIRDRGVKIIENLYSAKRKKKLDSNIEDALTGKFIEKFGGKEDFLINLGLIALPVNNEEAIQKWLSSENEKPEAVGPAREIVERLIAFRESRWILEFNVGDESGVLDTISSFLSQTGANVQIRSNPDNYARGRMTRIEIGFTRGNKKTVRLIKRLIMAEFADQIEIRGVYRERDKKPPKN